MGFKSKARKKRIATNDSSNEKKSKDIEFEGSVSCDIKDCNNWADKKVGGRKMAYARAVDVWGSSAFPRKIKKVSLCKAHYRVWKKEKKGEPKEWE